MANKLIPYNFDRIVNRSDDKMEVNSTAGTDPQEHSESSEDSMPALFDSSSLYSTAVTQPKDHSESSEDSMPALINEYSEVVSEKNRDDKGSGYSSDSNGDSEPRGFSRWSFIHLLS
jgi:hypothetical protein